jgi:hypothetical protein
MAHPSDTFDPSLLSRARLRTPPLASPPPMKPKILLEHQLPSSVPHHRRRHSSNTYLGLSAQKRQRALTIAGVSLVLLFLLAISRAGHHTREDGVRAGDDYVPVRAQGGMGLFGGRQRQADVQGEYDPSGVREEDDPDYAPKKLTGDEYEEEFGLIEPNEQVFEPPPGQSNLPSP